jgi:hypothetical protein
MAAQLRYDTAKSDWLQAAKQAQSEKDKARAYYDNEKDMGMIGDLSFAAWVPTNVRLEPFSTCMLY